LHDRVVHKRDEKTTNFHHRHGQDDTGISGAICRAFAPVEPATGKALSLRVVLKVDIGRLLWIKAGGDPALCPVSAPR
jgi:hypothetical protein